MDDPQRDLGEQADQLQHLRRLVVGPTSESIEQLRQQVEEKSIDAEDVGDVLPEAIGKSSKKKLARALGPTVSSALKQSIERDPQSLVDAISPIMGPAIRRSISQQIQAMVQSLNTALDHSLSPRGIRWRLEAWQTGKPFAEVVLLHTLVYRIEQLFLIDPNTGLLMQSVSADPSNEDADLVSSLLTAIQDFTRDSFEHRTEHESGSDLQSMKTNELNVWIEHGPDAVLAAAVRGEPPLTLRQRMQEVLEQLHVQHGAKLSNFRGDTSTLEVTRFDLEELLDSEYIDQKSDGSSETEPAETKEKNPWLAHLNWLVPACLLLALLVWGFRAQRARRYARIADVLDVPPKVEFEVADDVLRIRGEARHEWLMQAKNRMHRLSEFQHLDTSGITLTDQPWIDCMKELRATPGIMVTDAHLDGDYYVLRGLRDPLADHPHAILKKHGIANVRQSWETYRSLDSQLTIARLKKQLDFPSGIHLDPGEFGRLRIWGEAPQAWVRKLEMAIDLLEARSVVDISDINDSSES